MSETFYVPSDVFVGSQSSTYMARPYPRADDFFHPKFEDFLKKISHPFQLHRKLWEYAFIMHELETAGVLGSPSNGLGFGVGREKLPALFASMGCKITATDAPSGTGEGWTNSGEFSSSLQALNRAGVSIDDDRFLELVSYETCDMSRIGSHLCGYDFCWSACCLEHLGSLRAGFDFILNSIKTLKVGGVACHTTELNLSSNVSTVESGPTVLYRRKDLESLIEEVRSLGHDADDFRIEPLTSPIDHHVDVPPYTHNPHLKLMLGKFITTSVGITIRRGR